MIEIGEYIRTTKGYIYKVQSKEQLDVLKWQDAMIGEIKSNSKNIIDLVEEDDYINEEKVVEKLVTTNIDGHKLILIRLFNGVITNEEIKEILTHEQYERNCYRLED